MRIENRYSNKNVYINVQCSTTHNGKKMEIIQTSIKSWIDKYVVIYLYNGIVSIHAKWGFPRGSKGKESACNVEDPSSIPGSGKFPGEENGNSLQYSCLENPRGALWATGL